VINTGAGSQTYNGPVSLTHDAALTAANATFTGTVTGLFNLTVNASGTATFVDSVGVGTPLAGLTVTAPTISLHNVTTTGPQTYNGDVTFHSNYTSNADFMANGNVTLADDSVVSAANIIFVGTVDSAVDGAWSLTTSSPGTTKFGGAIGAKTD